MEMKMEPGPCLSFLPADDGPYSKGSKDAGGADVALICRRQSIPGNDPPLLPLPLSWRHGELWVWALMLTCFVTLDQSLNLSDPPL